MLGRRKDGRIGEKIGKRIYGKISGRIGYRSSGNMIIT